MAHDPFSGDTSCQTFSRPEAVAMALADGLIQYALCVARTDRTLAVGMLEKVNPHILKMLASLDVTESDYDLVASLMNKIEALVADAKFPAARPPPSMSRH